MKKLITMALAIMVMMAFSMTLVACGESKAAVQNENATSVTTATSAQSTASAVADVKTTGKIDEKYLPSGDYPLPEGAQATIGGMDKSETAQYTISKYVDLQGNALGTWISLEFNGEKYYYGENEYDTFAKEWKNITGNEPRINMENYA